MPTRIEVRYQDAIPDPAGRALRQRIQTDLGLTLPEVRIVEVYTIDQALSAAELERARGELFTDPLTQLSTIGAPVAGRFDWAIEVGFLPGVTDNVGRTSKQAIEDLLKVKFGEGEAVYSSRQYLLSGELKREQVARLAGWLHNPLIQRAYVKSYSEFRDADGMEVPVPKVSLPKSERVDEVDLEQSQDELLKLGKAGVLDRVAKDGAEIRRGPLALDLKALHIIRDYFKKEGRRPTDVELESLAQTWSEHCKHTIFAARLDEVDSLYRTYIKAATQEVRRRRGEKDFCVSVFTDNSGVIRFTDDYNLCYKVETHNSPSALDPYGGAITGIVGVNRDPMGTGQGARLVINIYGFCFGNPFWNQPLPSRDREGKNPILHPKVIFEGVRQGVEHGGNKSGIPTPHGFLIFDDRYMGKPLVFVGTVGLMPRIVRGRPSHEKQARPGDLIVMAGGRVGKDGIHGATFSSESLHEGSPAGAVQIGDPITQKKMHDAQLEARDLGLYHSVTDNGAGGLSCSVGEMARECGGCEVELEKVPIKYAGLLPYEVWISESQERMTYAVPPDRLQPFLELMRRRDVEATVIGRFTDSGRCRVTLSGRAIMDVDLNFLHDGLPQRELRSEYRPPQEREPAVKPRKSYTEVLRQMLSRLNLCSKEYVVRQYDHEVLAGSVIKPLIGVASDVLSDAVVTRPLLDSLSGVALSHGILPWYGDLDPAAMAFCGIDTAIRNVIAVGANPDRIALLDNFCWCSSDEPFRLGQLKRAAEACFQAVLGYGAPFISGKDSMYNDFKGFDPAGQPIKISVPPTLLVSSLGLVDDSRKCVTLDAKAPGDLLYVIGETFDECGGSEYYAWLGESKGGSRRLGRNVPQVNIAAALARYRKVHQAIQEELLASCHSLGLGGLSVGLAKIAMAGELGLSVDLEAVPASPKLRLDKRLFSESQSRFLVTVAPHDGKRFEALFAGEPVALIGRVTKEKVLLLQGPEGPVVEAEVLELKSAYQKTLDW